MFSKVTLTYDSITTDGHYRQEYSFHLSSNDLILDRYIKLLKQGKQRNFRLLGKYYRIDKRESTINISNVPFDSRIEQDAKDGLTKSIRVILKP